MATSYEPCTIMPLFFIIKTSDLCPGRGIPAAYLRRSRRGICREADIVTPTVINQAAMERDLLALATLMGGADDEKLTGALERLVHACDPCISCAVHVLRI